MAARPRALAGGTLTVQVSSVNRRSLDLSIKLPADWECLEAEIGETVRRVASRGKVHVDVEYTATGGRDEPSWNDAAVGVALDRLAALADARQIRFEPTAELLWQIASAQRVSVETPSADLARVPRSSRRSPRRCAGFAAMRAKEGAALLADFNGTHCGVPRARGRRCGAGASGGAVLPRSAPEAPPRGRTGPQRRGRAGPARDRPVRRPLRCHGGDHALQEPHRPAIGPPEIRGRDGAQGGLYPPGDGARGQHDRKQRRTTWRLRRASSSSRTSSSGSASRWPTWSRAEARPVSRIHFTSTVPIETFCGG